MKRRGFLAFLGGGAIAGPSMVKAAAAQTMADLSLSNVQLPGATLYGSQVTGGFAVAQDTSWIDHQKLELAKLLGRSMGWHREQMAKTAVHSLDPDLASMRAPSLSWKMCQQQERNYWREFESQKSFFQRVIDGEFS